MVIAERQEIPLGEEDDDDEENDLSRLMPSTLGFLERPDLAAFWAPDEEDSSKLGSPVVRLAKSARPIASKLDQVTAPVPSRTKNGLMDVAEFWAIEERKEVEERYDSLKSRLSMVRFKKSTRPIVNTLDLSFDKRKVPASVLSRPKSGLMDVDEFWAMEERREAEEGYDSSTSRLSMVRSKANAGVRKVVHNLDSLLRFNPVREMEVETGDATRVDSVQPLQEIEELERSREKHGDGTVLDAAEIESVCNPEEFESVDVVVNAVDAANRCSSPIFEIEDFESPLIAKLDLRSLSKRRKFDSPIRKLNLSTLIGSKVLAEEESIARKSFEFITAEVQSSPKELENNTPETLDLDDVINEIIEDTQKQHNTEQEPKELLENSISIPMASLEITKEGTVPLEDNLEPQLSDISHDDGVCPCETSESLVSETKEIEDSISKKQTEIHTPKDSTVGRETRVARPRKRGKRKLEGAADVEISPWLQEAGMEWKNGKRCSTRIRSRPLEYWRGERLLYGRIHKAMPTLIGIKHSSPLPPRPKKGEAVKEFKVDSFVPEQFKHLVKLAAK